MRGPSCGHDFDFHLQSWLAAAAAFHSGSAVPHWVDGANYGAGEPRFVFYPPLSWLLGAGLGSVLPWTLVPFVFTALCLAGAAWSMHRFAARLCSPSAAVLASTLYAVSPYLLFTAYERSAFGELLAAAFFPALLDALTRPRLPVLQAATLLAALWYSNAPAGVMGCYLVLLALFWQLTWQLGTGWAARRALSPPPLPSRVFLSTLLRAAGALGLGCALAADYLLPAWYEQRFVAIGRAVGPGMRVEDSFLFGHTGEPFHDAVLHSASWIAAWTLGLGLLAGVAVPLRHRRTALHSHPGIVQPSGPDHAAPAPYAAGFCLLLLLGCSLLQLPFTSPVWYALPELGFLQFPWRLLLPASAAAAVLIASALDRTATALKLGAALVFAAGLVTWAAGTRCQPCDEEDNVSAQVALFASGAGFEGTDEYAPTGTDNGEIQQGLPLVRLLRAPDADEGDDSDAPNPPWHTDAQETVPGIVNVRTWTAGHVLVRLRPDADAWAVLRRERWPSASVLLNGKPCGAACVSREDGLLTVHLPARQWSRLELRAVTPLDLSLGRTLTLFALLLALAQRRWGRWARWGRGSRAFMMGRK